MNWEILAERSIDMLCVADERRRFVWLNRRWTRVLGWTLEELMSTEFTCFIHPDDLDATFTEEARLMRIDGYETHQFVNRYRRRDGGYSSLEWNATIGDDGMLYGIVRDVTEQRARAERLIHIERLASIGELAAGVAHEINNPLQFLTMNLEMLREDLAEFGLYDEAFSESIEGALEGAERVRKIVGALRRFVRRPGKKRARVAPKVLLDGALRMVKGRYAQDVWFELELEDDLPRVEVEEQSISQSLLNLLTNACQSVTQTGARGRVRVRVFQELGDMGAQVVFEVEDEGVGLEVDEPERVFEPFFTTKPSGEGTGLGLSITRGLIAAHGGDVTLSNRADARGALARLTLPLRHDLARGEGSLSEASEVAGSGAKVTHMRAPRVVRGPSVLLVDDEPTIVRSLARHLRSRGYEVETARSGREALELLCARSLCWNLVLCDLKMPEVDGKALREQMIALCPDLEPRLHFMTGDSWSAENRAFLESLERPHLDKPFVLSELRAFVEENIHV
jgi:PAS domain S-box-containing protein